MGALLQLARIVLVLGSAGSAGSGRLAGYYAMRTVSLFIFGVFWHILLLLLMLFGAFWLMTILDPGFFSMWFM
jgi:hypothetical protein